VGKTILADLRRGDLKSSFTRDLRELHDFYLDEQARERLKSKRRGRRLFLRVWWILKSLIMNLSPIRRLLLVISLWLGLLQTQLSFPAGPGEVHLDLRVAGFLLLLIILMLELKDKLLARSELEVGRKVQRALLPEENPTLAGWDLLLYTRPANEVGGDLVDYHALGDGRLAVVLGDVSGKGLGAALLMAKLQATLWAIAGGFSSLAELGARMNAIMCRDGLPGRFATLVYLEVPPDGGAVRVLNAGHMPPIVIGGEGASELKPVAPPLGIVPDATYAEQRLDVGPGQMVVAYSDGLTEAVNESGEFYGEGRLQELLPRIQSLSAEAACELILTEVRSFIGEARYSDDLSLVLLRRK
jgi:sigma-B regulation protein RsbU (phosphoserine phosphatase)